MRYVYCDESTFSDPKPCIGIGMLITETEIAPSAIEEALQRLQNDPDILIEPAKKLDEQTLKRRYFHASEDSKNAHSYLCEQINKLDAAEFVCDFFDKYKLPTHEQYDDYLYHQASILSSIRATYTIDHVKFYFESRDNLSIDSLIKMYKDLEQNSLMGIYNLPFIPHFFPPVSFEIADKSNPGIQFVDFILWAVNRHVNGESTWFERINFSSKTSFSTESGSWGGQDINIGNGLGKPKVYYTVQDFPVNPDSKITKDILVNFYLHAAKVIEYYINNPPHHINHLFDEDAREIVKRKKDQYCSNYFDKLASLYLKIFDMAPLITPSSTSQEKEFLLLSKKYMSLLLRYDLINGVRTKIWLESVRKELIKNKPELLDF